MRPIIYVILGIYALWFLFMQPGEVKYGAGVLAPKRPLQEKVSSKESFNFKDYRITPLAEFAVTAKVLSRKNYRFGREADLSPVDFALGWGRMSDESVLAQLNISQSNRWYHWRAETLPMQMDEISVSSANMHMIPASKYVESQLSKVKKGDVVSISGNLVRVDASDGWRWISSLSRNDTGAGACELVFVRALDGVDFADRYSNSK